MKGNMATVLFVVFFSSLIVSCAPAPPLESPKTGYSITGFVGASLSAPAISETIMLLDGETSKPITSVETNLAGKYHFYHLPPGPYLIRVGHITREVLLMDGSKRVDIEWNDCSTCTKR